MIIPVLVITLIGRSLSSRLRLEVHSGCSQCRIALAHRGLQRQYLSAFELEPTTTAQTCRQGNRTEPYAHQSADRQPNSIKQSPNLAVTAL